MMKAFRTMLKTELKLSIRDMNMPIFAICMPVVITIIIGIIFNQKPAFKGADYTFLQQSFGALSTIAICAGGVMGLPLVIADYRHKKILKRFKVTPIDKSVILAVEVFVYGIYSIISLILNYIVARLFFNFQFIGSVPLFLGAYFLVMISMFSIGLMVGGISPNIKIASVITSILYFPMLIFSGATLPYEVMPSSLRKFSNILPLTQGIKLLKNSSLNLSNGDVITPIISMILITIICGILSIKFFRWE